MFILKYAIKYDEFLTACVGMFGELTPRRIAYNCCGACHLATDDRKRTAQRSAAGSTPQKGMF